MPIDTLPMSRSYDEYNMARKCYSHSKLIGDAHIYQNRRICNEQEKTCHRSAHRCANGGGVAPALGASWTHSSMGGTVTVSGRTISLKDSVDDGRFVSAHYVYDNSQSRGSLSNKRGYGKSVAVSELTNINNDKICRSRWLQPMECGAWKYAN